MRRRTGAAAGCAGPAVVRRFAVRACGLLGVGTLVGCPRAMEQLKVGAGGRAAHGCGVSATAF